AAPAPRRRGARSARTSWRAAYPRRSNQHAKLPHEVAHRDFVRPPVHPRLVPLMKRIISVFAVLGLVGCFLPVVPGVSMFDLHHVDWHVWLVLAAFALPAYVDAAATES